MRITRRTWILLTSAMMELSIGTIGKGASVDVELNCLSIQIRTSTNEIGGKQIPVGFTLVDLPAKQINQEFRELGTPFNFPNLGIFKEPVASLVETHKTCFVQMPNGELDWSTWVIHGAQMAVPRLDDLDSNGIPDFYDPEQSVSESETLGHVNLDPRGPDKPMKSRWNRNSGSAIGHVRFEIDDPFLTGVTEHEFALVVYRGRLEYQRTNSSIKGTLALQRVGVPGETLQGSCNLTRAASSLLLVTKVLLTNEMGAAITAQLIPGSGELIRKGTKYRASLDFGDGYPSTNTKDYQSWRMSLVDSNDADSNGIPDITDPIVVPPYQAPTISAVASEGKLQLVFTGTVGTQFKLQRSSTLGLGIEWQTLQTIRLDTASQILALDLDSSAAHFFRTIKP